jgi:hypothetical protein
MPHGKQTFWAGLQLLARLTLNAGKHTANQPARLAHLDDGNDRAILVQGDEGPAQVVRLGHRGTPSIRCSDEVATSSPPPIASVSPAEKASLSAMTLGHRSGRLSSRVQLGPLRGLPFHGALGPMNFSFSGPEAGLSSLRAT